MLYVQVVQADGVVDDVDISSEQGGIDVEKAKLRMKAQDRIDRDKERTRIKQKHRDIKRKEREERQADAVVSFFLFFLSGIYKK